MSSCWLNACLQLILAALDRCSQNINLDSELGKEILNIVNHPPNRLIDPTPVKNILICAEDTRIALRKSELINTITDSKKLANQLANVDQLYLNLRSGQQCVRDFFICIQENMDNWLDVYQLFNFSTINSTTCKSCNHENKFEQSQIYLEMDVPPDGSSPSNAVEESLNDSCIVEYHCEDGCQIKFQAEKRTFLKSVEETDYLIVLLRRTMYGNNANMIVANMINSTERIKLR